MNILKLPGQWTPVLALAPVIALAAFARQMPQWLAFALSLAAVIWAVACTAVYWRNLDEIARAGQKTAWFWGGTLGAAAALAIAAMLPPAQNLIRDSIAGLTGPRSIEDSGFVVGALYVLAAQLVGFTLYWLGWWIAKR